MAELALQKYLPGVSRQIYGCMGLGGGWDSQPVSVDHVRQTHEIIDASLQAGVNLFDHADIYTFGKAETVFGRVLSECPSLRDEIYIQSKCGIRFEDEQGPGRYDFSRDWLMHSVDGILTRLGCGYLDVLMLHRPDPLMELDELAGVLTELHSSGKVRHFGVSNMHHYQIENIQEAAGLPVVCNQLEMSLQAHTWLDEGVYAGNNSANGSAYSAGTLEYCRTGGVQVQAWGSLCQGVYSGRVLDDQAAKVKETATLVERLSKSYECSREAIVLAWLQRHPLGIQPVIGTTNPERILACSQANSVDISREDWYALYLSARGKSLP